MNSSLLNHPRRGITLVEAVIIIALVAIVAALIFPPYTGPRVKSANVKALSNARQISLALRLYADDHGGKYPSFTLKDGKPTTTPVRDSNTAFAQLFPDYLTTEAIFWVPQSPFCSTNPPDEITDKPPLDTPVDTLKPGENEWAYVLQLTESSAPAFPLIASGFADPVAHTYTADSTKKGGRWKGAQVIVTRLDGSSAVLPIDQATMQVTGSNGAATPGDIFTTANSANGWLAPENTVVNPK